MNMTYSKTNITCYMYKYKIILLNIYNYVYIYIHNKVIRRIKITNISLPKMLSVALWKLPCLYLHPLSTTDLLSVVPENFSFLAFHLGVII